MENIKKIFLDLWILYKNFIHWNISKILIYLFSFLLWILFSLPFFLVLSILFFVDPINWKDIISTYFTTGTVGFSFFEAISVWIWYIILEWLLFILWFFWFIFWYSYSFINILNLNLKYLNWEKISYMKNVYFDFTYIKKYFYILNWLWLFFLVFLLLFLFIFFIVVMLFWWIDSVYNLSITNTYFNIFTLILFIIFVFVFLYYAFRLSFWYLVMLDDNNDIKNIKWIYFIKRSYNITSWFKKILIFIGFSFMFAVLFDIIDYVWDMLSTYWEIYVILFSVFVFLVFNWIFEMFLVSFYKNILVWKQEIINEKQ